MAAGDTDDTECYDQFAKCCELIFGHDEEAESTTVETAGSTTDGGATETPAERETTTTDVIPGVTEDESATDGENAESATEG